MVISARRFGSGYTLIELMIVIAIVAIFASIAIASYGNYVRSGKLSESFAMLSDYRLKMEQFKQDNHSYADPINTTSCGVPPPATNNNFSIACVIAASGVQFSATASNKAGAGLGNTSDYSYSIDQNGVQNTLRYAGTTGPIGIWKMK